MCGTLSERLLQAKKSPAKIHPYDVVRQGVPNRCTRHLLSASPQSLMGRRKPQRYSANQLFLLLSHRKLNECGTLPVQCPLDGVFELGEVFDPCTEGAEGGPFSIAKA
jgi:hypothetical protein